MDASIRLALAAKAYQVFGGPAKFLCFPPPDYPLAFSPRQLGFATGFDTAEELRAFREFSNAANRVVRGVLYEPAEEGTLDRVVRHVLEHGECANASADGGDEERYRTVLALLYEDPTQTVRTPSEAVRVYNRYRDTVQIAKEHYAARSITAELGSDAEEKARWSSIEEPLLRSQIQQLEGEWLDKGRRLEIEAAREFERQYEQRQAVMTWRDWRVHFNVDLDLLTDPEQIEFAPTVLSPADIFEAQDWQDMVLTAGEISSLIATADPALRAAFDQPETSDVETVSFQYRSAKLERAWLPRDLFSARFWRLPGGSRQVSDGGGAGMCPAYAVAVVFARKVKVTRRPSAGAGATLTVLPVDALFGRTKVLVQEPVNLNLRQLTEVKHEPDFLSLNSAAIVRDHRRDAGSRRPWPRRLRGSEIAVLNPEIGVAEPKPESPPPPPEPTDDRTAILAFICRRVPASPDPDPGLHWS